MTIVLLGLLLVNSAQPSSWTIVGPEQPFVLDLTARRAQRVRLRVLDNSGLPVSGVAVTVAVPAAGPSASIDRGLRELTKVSDRHGRVEFRLKPTNQPGRWDLQVRTRLGDKTQQNAVSITSGVAERTERAAFAGWTFVLLLSAGLLITTLSQL